MFFPFSKHLVLQTVQELKKKKKKKEKKKKCCKNKQDQSEELELIFSVLCTKEKKKKYPFS